MTTQRKTAIVCSLICLMVVVNYMLKARVDILTMVCVGWFAVFSVAIFWEHLIMKLFIVGTLFSIGSVQLFQGENSSYLGIVIFAMAYFYCHTFGFLHHQAIVKTVLIACGFAALVGISTEGNLSNILMRTGMTVTIVSLSWFALGELIERAHRLAEIEKNELFMKFKKAVEAGLSIAEWEKGDCQDGPEGN